MFLLQLNSNSTNFTTIIAFRQPVYVFVINNCKSSSDWATSFLTCSLLPNSLGESFKNFWQISDLTSEEK